MAVRLCANDGAACASKSTAHRDVAIYLRRAGAVACALLRGDLFLFIIVASVCSIFTSRIRSKPSALALHLRQIRIGCAYSDSGGESPQNFGRGQMIMPVVTM